MSQTLEGIRRLQQMNSMQRPQQPSAPMMPANPMPQMNPQPVGLNPMVMDENQRRRAQGDAIIRMAAEMGNPKHTGKGLNRMLATLVAGINPALDAYRAAESSEIDKNLMSYKIQRDEENEQYRRLKEAEREAKRERREFEYMSGIKGSRSGAKVGRKGSPYYGLPALGKLIMQEHEIKEGFAPGSNGTIPITPEQQEEYLLQNELARQKVGTDANARQRALDAKNIIKSIERTNLDDLVSFSGAQGYMKLAKEKAKDAFGMSSDKYKKYQAAKSATELEADEIRKFLGSSISPTATEALHTLVDPTGPDVSPETAKLKVEAARKVLKSQLKTYQDSLRSVKPYRDDEGEKESDYHNHSNENQKNITKEVYGVINGHEVKIPIELVPQFQADGGVISGY